MSAIFRICGHESQPGLQIVEKLATPQVTDILQKMSLYQLYVFTLVFF